MKKYIIAFALLIGLSSLNNSVQAQSINVSINIGRQPAWGPVGYNYVNYYYLPDIDVYYDVNLSMFYYFDRGRWVSARYLPYAYRNYDLYRMHKVVLNEREPWRYHQRHYRDYARYRGYHNQRIIRDSRDNRYRDSRNNRIAWYSDSHSQRDYRYDYNNYKYDNRRNDHKKDQVVRPKNNNNSHERNYGNNGNNRANDKKFDNRDNKNKRPESSFNNKGNSRNNKTMNENRSDRTRPSVERNSDRKSSNSVRPSSNTNYRMASSDKDNRR